ncbi:MAG: LysR family transcriptional regulator [Candidatus Ventricola sp.]
MNLNHLIYFNTLAVTQHYARAAAELYISQPSLSHAIAALEQELHVRLFERSGRGVRLTAEGRLFAEYVREALSTLDAGIAALADLNDLRLGSIITLSSDYIPQLVARCAQRLPSLRLHLFTGPSQSLLDSVEGGFYHAAICSRLPGYKSLTFIPLLSQPWLLLAPQDHPLRRLDRPATLADVAAWPLITYRAGNPVRALIDDAFAAASLRPSIVYELDDETAIGGMVSGGMGVAIVLDTCLLRSCTLTPVPAELSMPERVVCLAYRHGGPCSPALRSFLDWMAEDTPLMPPACPCDPAGAP